ncbi:MAG TPA: FtsX-like permease family protein [Steroidobacteraceae bacterium]|nr:FtsX-like permease family protein [Steroidobacteraceae bacterium]
MKCSRDEGGRAVWGVLWRSQMHEQPLRLVVTVLAIALGVALGTAVYLVNSAALNDFALAARRLVGVADVIVRGPREGFADALFVELARDPQVRLASPVLELEAAIPGRREPLKVLGLDPFRAAAMQPALIGDLEAHAAELFPASAILVSASAARNLGLKRGALLPVVVGSTRKLLQVVGVMPESAYGEDLGIMDLASAQWTFDRIGRLNRIDLGLDAGTAAGAFRERLKSRLPPGSVAVAPASERDRAVTVTRAYRVNLNMLALVSLLTGAFLVFSTQSLSVLRRRSSLGLMRSLGATRRQIEIGLLGEGTLIGLAGSLIGVVLGVAFAEGALRLLSGDLGNGQLHAPGAVLEAAPAALAAFLLVGTVVSALGAASPARAASRQAPAQALKGGDPRSGNAIRGSIAGAALLLVGGALAWLPPIGGIPVFGYAAIAGLLFGAVLLVPISTVSMLRFAPRLGHVVPDTALAQLEDNIGMSTLSLSSIIVSFSLMVAMAIMVYSFRVSFERWLDKVLPADLQIREPPGSDTAYWTPQQQAAAAAAAGVSRAEFRRTRQIFLDPARPPVSVIARGVSATRAATELPLVRSLPPPTPASGEPAWISEQLEDLYGYRLGGAIDLPLNGRARRFVIAGIWRDYARASGAVVISRDTYIAATGDRNANEASMWLESGAEPSRVIASLRAVLAPGGTAPEILATPVLHERSLQIFDRAFAITYALEAVAVIIGLIGVSFAASSTVLARRAEFGMLRHIGMSRRQVLGMLASEGILMSGCAVVYGLVLGGILSLVLVFVVNRQSFNWSIELALPLRQLTLLSVTLIAAAALTAVWSGRAATRREALIAVREDW